MRLINICKYRWGNLCLNFCTWYLISNLAVSHLVDMNSVYAEKKSFMFNIPIEQISVQ